MGRGVGRNQILSGPAGMAAGDGTRGLYLSNQPRLAQRRTLRPDAAKPPRRVIDTCEYCGGVRTGKSGFLPAFLKIAQGSLKELETHLLIAARAEIVKKSEIATLLAQSESVGKLLRALMRKLARY